MRTILFFFFVTLISTGTAWSQVDDSRGLKKVYEEPRIALIIGNANYNNSPLRNPINDARNIAKVLKERKFQVTLLTDVNQRKMVKAIHTFGKELKQGGVGLFYYAGHGMQVDGRNYLIPIQTNIEAEGDIEFEAVDVGRVLNRMEAAENRLNMVILDACRDNPFARSFRSSSKGLAQMDSPSGTLIAYATAPGKTAADGDGENGIYTENLLQQMQVSGLELSQMFKKVRAAVSHATDKKQIPWEASSVTGDFYFTPVEKSPPKQTTVMVPPPVTTGQNVDLEQEAWNLIKDSEDAAVVEMFLQQYPEGKFSFLARLKLEQLSTTSEQVAVSQNEHQQWLNRLYETIRQHRGEDRQAGGLVKKYIDTYGVEQLQKNLKLSSADTYKIGLIYRKGLGIPPDNEQAVFWFRKAAVEGYSSAQTRLGYMFRKGYGVVKNNSQAVYWYKKAAQQGDAQGQFNLGGMYLKGYGVPKNREQAIYHYKQAAKQGHAMAEQILRRLGVPTDY